ncbi:unnamed protein product [Rotaria sp. Silwood1]|nr:unnamed protein product [Rotaria sp. Silwood1]
MSSLCCTTYQACDSKIFSKAIFYCIQCDSLQCISCEKQIHNSSNNNKHERLDLNEIADEYCSINKSHPAVFHCSTCTLSFCYSCYKNKHQHSDGREHKLLKSKEEQTFITEKDNEHSRIEAKPFYPPLSSDEHNNNIHKQNNYKNTAASTFADIELNNYDEHYISPSQQQNDLKQTKTSTSTISEQKQNTNHIYKQEKLNEQLSDADYQRNQLNTDSNGVFLLLNAQEHLTVNNEFDFIRQLKSSSQDPNVKCISIIGNTGDGKSYTLNQVFFNGKEKFHTSSTTESCTMGVWAALDENQRTLILDTEGRLGLSQNDNIRNRLLLKILCISDIIIFRTRAPKLPNDMFQFLSDASNAFLKFFRRELENVMKNCEDNNRVASDVTPRKFMEMVVFAGSYISAPTKMLTEMVADQIAPSYWVPNKDVNECSHCKLIFGSEHSKHHCRACGHVFCDTCTTSRRVVPWIDADKPVRVCDKCYANPQSRPPSAIQNSSLSLIEKDKSDNQKSKQNGYDVGSSGDSASTASSGEHLSDLCLSPSDIFDIEHPGAGPVSVDIPASRRVYETFKTGLEKIGVNYPIELIKESTRPNYWRPDHECRACFICKRAFNSTTNRLHHCRNCGDAVCEQCSPKKRPVPERDWLTPVRVCKSCNEAMNESTSGQK